MQLRNGLGEDEVRLPYPQWGMRRPFHPSTHLIPGHITPWDPENGPKSVQFGGPKRGQIPVFHAPDPVNPGIPGSMEPPDMWVPGVLIPLSVLSSTSMVVSYGILYRWIIHISTYSGDVL